MPQDTCHFGNCAFAKRLKLKEPRECPNYYENLFISEKDEKKMILDCAPIRTMLMIQELSNRLIAVEKSQEEQRNSQVGINEFAGKILRAIEASGVKQLRG
jgi:hypothetical protein